MNRLNETESAVINFVGSLFLRDSFLTYYYIFFPDWCMILFANFFCFFYFLLFFFWCDAFFIFFSWNILLVNNFSVMSGCFLGWTSSKHKFKCLAQGQNILHLVRLGPVSDLKSVTLPLSHCTPWILFWNTWYIYCNLNHTFFFFKYHLICLN